MERDKYGWIDGNEYDPRNVEDKKYYHELILVTDNDARVSISRPVSNGCPVSDFFWQPLPQIPVALQNSITDMLPPE